MRRINPRNIKRQAISALADHPFDYRKLVFRHALVTSAVTLMVSLLGLLLNGSIADSQGLDGIGRASFLKSVYSVFMLAANILLPFWEMGISYTSIRVARRQNTDFPMLAQGLRRFAPLAGYHAMLALILFGFAFACLNVVIMPLMCLPMPEELQAAAQSLDFSDMAQIEAFYGEYADKMMKYTIPFWIVYIFAYGIIAVILNYRFRMCGYLLLEDERAGVMASFGISSRMTKGERKNLFMLDLSFWWYHGLTMLIALVVYIPDLLRAAGVTLPVDYEIASFVAYFVYLVFYLLVTGLAGAYYQTSMACAYEALRTPAEDNEI